MTIPKVTRRHKARRYALQALYQWQMTGEELNEIHRQFHERHSMKKIDEPYFEELLFKVPSHITEIDAEFTPFLDRDISDLTPVALAILRIATYEFLKRLDIPYKVVLNEALELCKTFGASEAHKFVNGVLDKTAHKLRKTEIDG